MSKQYQDFVPKFLLPRNIKSTATDAHPIAIVEMESELLGVGSEFSRKSRGQVQIEEIQIEIEFGWKGGLKRGVLDSVQKEMNFPRRNKFDGLVDVA